jgi:S-adenosylmethionine:tRNA ribosyltransferase-isomerase
MCGDHAGLGRHDHRQFRTGAGREGLGRFAVAVDAAELDYDLPAERIAQAPIEPRDAARLLVDHGPGAAPSHRHVRDLPDLLDPGDLLVVNDTRVRRARLQLRKESGGAVEVLLLEPHGDGWEALVRPSKRVAPGTRLQADGLELQVDDDLGEGRRVVRVLSGDLDQHGDIPLPPYIHQPLADAERYQTVYAERPASAAAPTAGLHLTSAVLDASAARGIGLARVELVVGLDTFRPIAVDRLEDHPMHSEAYAVPASTVEAIAATRDGGGRVVAVGTTVVRALEAWAATGSTDGRTRLFIRPGFEFAVVDRLVTNFHLPRTTLLALVAAFAGPHWRDLYAAALADDRYRFLSFGDAMLLTRQQ